MFLKVTWAVLRSCLYMETSEGVALPDVMTA